MSLATLLCSNGKHWRAILKLQHNHQRIWGAHDRDWCSRVIPHVKLPSARVTRLLLMPGP